MFCGIIKKHLLLVMELWRLRALEFLSALSMQADLMVTSLTDGSSSVPWSGPN